MMRLALQVTGYYTLIVGVLLLFPNLGAGVFERPVTDAAVESGWGAALITIGIIGIIAASNIEKYGGLALAFVFGLVLAALDLAYFWATEAYTARHVLVPIIIDVALAVWIWSVRSR